MLRSPIECLFVLNDPAVRCIMKQPEGPADKYLSREAKKLVLSTPMVQQLARDGGAEHWVGRCRLKPAETRLESALVLYMGRPPVDNDFLTLIKWEGPLCTVQRLEAKCDEALSYFAFNFKLRRYHRVSADRAKQAGPRSRVHVHPAHVRPLYLESNGILGSGEHVSLTCPPSCPSTCPTMPSMPPLCQLYVPSVCPLYLLCPSMSLHVPCVPYMFPCISPLDLYMSPCMSLHMSLFIPSYLLSMCPNSLTSQA
jgi:hypothetical protein